MGRRSQGDFNDEINAHLALEIDRLRQEGLSEDEARTAALRQFGNVTMAQERFYESGRGLWLDHALRDLRYGARRLVKDWSFSLAVVTLLALGIGANTAIFSVVYAVLLKPLAYPDADRIVSIENFRTNVGLINPTVSAPDFKDWQAQNTVMAAMAYHSGGQSSTVVNGSPEYASVRRVTPQFFAVFGQSASVGRLLTDGDESAPVMVASHDWATAHFGDAASAVGKSILIRGRAAEIVGVAAPGFRYPNETDLWLPTRVAAGTPSRNGHNFLAVGKLKADVSLASAREQMRVISDRLAQTYPDNRFKSVALTPLRDRLTLNVQTTLWVLMGAVAIVLLIACANIGNLLLARATTRTREVALRIALGASRSRVIRQLLTEYALLAAVATIAGVALAYLMLAALVSAAPAGLPRLDEVRIDGGVLLFALGASILSTVIFGLVPAFQASRLALTETLKRGGAGTGAVSGPHRARFVLVVAEVALSVMLLAGAGLLLRSFQRLHDVDLGLTTERVLAIDTLFPVNTPEDERASASFDRDLIARARALPGAEQVSAASFTPFDGSMSTSIVQVEGQPEPPPGEGVSADIQVVAPHYFDTLRIPLRGGRDFADSDTPETRLVVIVNETLARMALPDASALGQRIKVGYVPSTSTWMEIVGVAADSRRVDPGRPPQPEIYLPGGQHPLVGRGLTVLLRTRQPPDTLIAPLRDAIRQLNPNIPVRFETMEHAFSQSLAYPRFRTALVGAFAGLAVLLAVVGLFSVLAYLVGQRTKEFAVRLAMGARASDIVRLVIREGLRLVCAGIALGLVGAFALARLLTGLLFGVSAWDPGTYVAIVCLLFLAALLASLLPALRAAAVNPLASLRHE